MAVELSAWCALPRPGTLPSSPAIWQRASLCCPPLPSPGTTQTLSSRHRCQHSSSSSPSLPQTGQLHGHNLPCKRRFWTTKLCLRNSSLLLAINLRTVRNIHTHAGKIPSMSAPSHTHFGHEEQWGRPFWAIFCLSASLLFAAYLRTQTARRVHSSCRGRHHLGGQRFALASSGLGVQ